MSEIYCTLEQKDCEYEPTLMEEGNVFWNLRGTNVIYTCPECGNCVLLVHPGEEE